MKKIRVLQTVSLMHQGGMENLIMNIYRNIDRNKVQFDFIVHHKEKAYFDDEIEKLGGKIYRFSFLDDKNIFKYIKELNCFFKEHKEYKIIHGHLASIGFLYLSIAKKHKVPIRIAHSHGASHLKNIKGYIKNFLFKFYKYPANRYYACSTEAGNYLFKNKNFELIHNAINTEQFKFNEIKRQEIRKKYNIPNKDILIGHVGRFNLQKNHTFIIKIFAKILQKNKNYTLMLIGDGELKNKMMDLVKNLGIEDKVIFTGLVQNTYDYYSAMDLFVLPSLFEGLPVVGVETQANGLTTIMADNITKEVKINDNIYYLPITKIDNWVDFILNLNFSDIENRKKKNEVVNQSNFNMKQLSKNIENKYLELHSGTTR